MTASTIGFERTTETDMATDDERREVARRLREVEKHAIPDARISDNPMTVYFIAAAALYDLPYVRGLFSRLADLIEPDTTTDTTKSPADTTKCDRDALLSLADDLDYAGAAVENVAYIDQTFHESACRIREALGVDDD